MQETHSVNRFVNLLNADVNEPLTSITSMFVSLAEQVPKLP